MNCPNCKHDLLNHTFSENYTGCDICKCQKSVVECFETILAEAKQLITESLIDVGCDCDFCVEAKAFIAKLEDSPA